MSAPIVGARIRERRRALGVTQAELARRMGISASYLNLIESAKRGVSPRLVRAAAKALGLPPEALDGAAERRLAGLLAEMAADPDFADLALDPAQTAELVARAPGWARALARAWSASREKSRMLDALSDRLAHDPFLSDAVHRMLTNIAAIRSTSEILAAVEDIEPPQRARFHHILTEESARLSEVAQSLAQFFDADRAGARAAAPAEEIDEAFLAADNRFDRLEAAAEALRARLGLGLEAALDPAALAPVLAGQPAPRALSREETLRAAARAAVLSTCAEALEAELDARPPLRAEAARRRAREALADYAADALIAPYGPFLEAGRAAAWDADALAARFGAGFDHAARRIAAMTRPGAAGPRAAHMRVNAAGLALSRRLLPEIVLPRYGAACPLWAVYRALSAPGRTLRQLAAFPDGARVVFVARAADAGDGAFGRPEQIRATLLALPEQAAADTIYAARPGEQPEPVGPNCRICPRADCAHRAEDPVFG
ncbi:short-chain fatty acyl-CoA regulator family protein [Oceanicella actignis]|uniref:HTH cro/C1-type domain-containing protein n=1 Tax=Oceanicella actignis TaxID=1189325 RepID=A0A1M7S7V8_9RHOB|nr:short-chain fatty acyl-CoA regulator family protein [Oceanicella actignis]SET33397.1 hypothetical protein SAMN04488119_103501 [Oceanicella actignis]SHN54520.1 hypothetical protein SAMN05216200_1027 [Oceanicella actignis]